MLVDAAFNDITHAVIGGFVAERTLPIVYKGITLNAAYRLDLIVEDVVVIEVKSVASLLSVHEAQVLTYMRLSGCRAKRDHRRRGTA